MNERVRGSTQLLRQLRGHPRRFAFGQTQNRFEPGTIAVEPRSGFAQKEVEVVKVFL